MTAPFIPIPVPIPIHGCGGYQREDEPKVVIAADDPDDVPATYGRAHHEDAGLDPLDEALPLDGGSST